MAWNYNATDLDDTTVSGRLNSVRYLVGDTDTNSQQVQDEEIEFSLTQTNDNIYNAASFVAGTIASKYARLVTTQLDGVLESQYSDLSNNYRKLALELKSMGQKYSAGGLGVFAGGLLISNINAVRSNTNRFPSSFRMDRFRFPGTDQERLADEF